MKTSGACFCGAITYTATINEDFVGVCHCRDCQIFGGSAFRMVALAKPDEFKITHGEPKYFDKMSATGNTRRMVFCGECGTHLCSLPPEPISENSFVSIRISTSNDFAQLKPVAEIYCESRVDWLTPMDNALQFERMP
ncbi:MAG: GFA family protein [Pseudomonadota bacterium]